MQVSQRKAAMGDKQAIGEKKRPRHLRNQPYRQLAVVLNPFMRQVGI